jgi:hypothetical protein
MAIQLPTYNSPYSATPLTNVYVRIVEVNLNFADRVGRIVCHVYADRATYDAGKQAVGSFAYPISPLARPATDEQGGILTRQPDGTYKNAQGQTVTPAAPGFPGFDELVNLAVVPDALPHGTLVYDVLKSLLYQLLKTQPEFAGSQDV